jgi:hypothetical protein
VSRGESWRRRLGPPFVIFGVALAVRVVYLLSIRNAFFFEHLQTEPQHYDAWATEIVRGTAHASVPFDEAPAYPYFVALIYAVVGHSVMAVCAVQALLGAAASAAIGMVAGRGAGRRAAWIAGGVAAFYAPSIYFTGQLEPATLAVAAVCGALVITPDDAATPRRWILAALAWSGALVVRSELVLALPVLVAHAWLCAGRRRALRVAIVPAALLAASLAINTIGSGHPVLLTTGSGVNLWLGNNPDADGVNPFIHGRLEGVVHDVEAGSSDAIEADQAFRGRALAFVHDAPGAAAKLLVKKLAWTFTHRELPNAMDIQWQTSQSWVFRPPWFPIGFGLVLPLAVAGALLVGRDWRRRLILVAPIVVAVITCVALFTNARFRLVMVPSLIVLAALAIDRGLQLAAISDPRRHRRQLAMAAAGAAVGVVVAWANLADVAHYRISQIDVNTGVLERGAGHLERAERYLRSGLHGDPEDRAAWIQLALTVEASGRADAARAVWLDALAHMPGDPTIRALAAEHLRGRSSP